MNLPTYIQDFLRKHDTMTLATVGLNGEPQAAAVFYAVDERSRLYFLSSPRSRHIQNLERVPRVAATIQADHQPWREICGLQLEGTVRQLTNPAELVRGAAVYVSTFDFLAEFKDLLLHPGSQRSGKGASNLPRALIDSRLYELRLTWARIIDNTQGFGYKQETARQSP